MKALVKTLSGSLIMSLSICMLGIGGGVESLLKNKDGGLEILIGVWTIASVAVALFGLGRMVAGLFRLFLLIRPVIEDLRRTKLAYVQSVRATVRIP